jgi:hypothetical protein
MAPYIGKNAVVTFGGTTLNTSYRTFKQTGSVDMVDKSAGADAHKTFIAALMDDGFDFECLMDGTQVWAACTPGTEGSLIISREGTTAGKPKTTMVAVVAKRDSSVAYNDLATMSVSFQPSSSPVEGTN